MKDESRAEDSLLPTFTRQSWLYRVCQAICRFVTLTMFDLKTWGLEHIPRRGGVLIVANHQSYLDPALLGVNVPRAMSFLAKSELFANKLFAALIRGLNAFPVRQGEGDVGAVRETIRRLQDGHVLVLFPEGGRSGTPELEPLEAGVGLIVRRAGPTVKVVPAAIHGAFEAWSRYRKLPQAWPVRVKYGPALDLSEKKGAEIVKILENEIRRLQQELKSKSGESSSQVARQDGR